jgi:UDP:flavonoid glycosyltransferase YjiC (YdhE family)
MLGEAATGAGRVLPKTASADEILSAVRSLLQNPSFRHAAAAISARLRSRNGATAAADELAGTILKATLGVSSYEICRCIQGVKC